MAVLEEKKGCLLGIIPLEPRMPLSSLEIHGNYNCQKLVNF